MANQLRNATFLDLTDGWAPVGGAVGVDEAVRGAHGRHALVNAAGGIVSASAVPVQAGRMIEAMVHAWASGGPPVVAVVIGATVVPVPLVREGDGRAKRGLPSTYSLHRLRIPSPATGAAELRITGPGAVAIVKPFLDGAAPTWRQQWGVGPHASPDLNRPTWPATIPLPAQDGLDAEPTPMRTGYETDAGIPTTRRLASRPWARLNIELRLDAEQRDDLQVFFESRLQPFWMVRHDTQQVGWARWMQDGDPRDSGAGPNRRTTVGLIFQVI